MKIVTELFGLSAVSMEETKNAWQTVLAKGLADRGWPNKFKLNIFLLNFREQMRSPCKQPGAKVLSNAL